jgi:hypothetical protein
MPEAERAAAIEELELAEYERYAAGGRARAASAVRNEDGKFIAGAGGEDAPRPQPLPKLNNSQEAMRFRSNLLPFCACW